MLVAFNATQLERWGYDSSTVFIDPMEPAFRPQNVVVKDFTEETIREKLDWFWSLDAYSRTAEHGSRKRRSAN
jgi:bilirubin oxidase